LKGAQAIQRVGENGRTVRYKFLTRPVEPPDAPGDTQTKVNEENCTGLDRSRPVQFHASESDSDSGSDDDDDDALAQKRNRIARLLSEFLIEEPTRSRLLETLVPFSETEMRAICERTKHETVWRNPSGVIVKRLSAFALGLQDPLPVFQTVMATPPAAPARQQTARRGKGGGVTIRPQIAEHTDAQRDAARERARSNIAERAARRAMAGGAQ